MKQPKKGGFQTPLENYHFAMALDQFVLKNPVYPELAATPEPAGKKKK